MEEITRRLGKEIPFFSNKIKLQYLLMIIIGSFFFFGVRGGIIAFLIIWFGNKQALNNHNPRTQNEQRNSNPQTPNFFNQVTNNVSNFFGDQNNKKEDTKKGENRKFMSMSEINK